MERLKKSGKFNGQMAAHLSLRNLIRGSLRCTVSVLMVLISMAAWSQSTNDFRTTADGSWNAIASWERFDGTAWIVATYYPGNGSTNDVTVAHTLGANVVINLPGNLSVSGSLNLGASNFTVSGNTTISGSLTDGNNNGVTTFTGKVTVLGSGALTTTAVTTVDRMVFSNGLSQQSSGAVSLAAATLGVNSQSIEIGNNTGNVSFSGAMSVSSPLVVFNTGDGTGAGSVSLGAVTNTAGITINRPVTFNGAATINAGISINSPVTFNSTSTLSASVVFNAPVIFTGASVINVGQTLTYPVTFNGNVTIADGQTITNRSQTTIQGVLNGSGANARWFNAANSSLEYRGATVPMATGLFDASATGNTVYYNLNGTQIIKATNYYHLRTGTNGVASTQSKTVETAGSSLQVGGNLELDNYSVFYLGAGAKSITVAGNVTLAGSLTYLRTNNTDVIHSLSIGGYLETNGGEVRLHYGTANRYCDLTMTGSGDVIRGTGTLFYLRNLTLSGSDAKTSSYSGPISFYGGTGTNSFANNGGAFTATAGKYSFLDAFDIGGNDDITFNDLQCGNNSQTIQTLGRDVTVNGILTVNHSNTTSSYLNINGRTLTLLGGFARANSGEFGGSDASNLILGNGNTPVVSGSLFFETGVHVLASLTHNVVNGSTYYGLGSLLSVSNLNITSGQLNNASNLTITNTFLNNGTYNQTSGITFFNLPFGTIPMTGSGVNTIQTLTVTDGTLDASSNMTVMAGFVNNSNATDAFRQTAGTTSFASGNTQTINSGTGTGAVTFHNLNIANGNTKTVARNVDVANHLTIADNTVLTLGTVPTAMNIGGDATIDGTLSFGTIIAKSISVAGKLIDVSGTINMTGAFAHELNLNGATNALSTFTTTANSGSRVNYGRNGDQTVFASPNYRNLQFSGSGVKTFSGATTINNLMTADGLATVSLGGQVLNALGNITIENGAGLLADAGAQLLIANGMSLTNKGRLSVMGTEGNRAIVSRSGTTGGYSIIQSDPAAVFAANQYEFQYLADGIVISDGAIDPANNFSNGSFANGTGAQYLQLTGLDLTGLPNVSNVAFGAGPSYNVSRTSGVGAINFDNASGALAGENYDNDNGNPGTLINWSYTASVYYSTGNVSAGLTSSWTRNSDGSGGNPTSVTDGLNTLIVQNGHTVTVDNSGNLDVKNLVIGQGTTGRLVIGVNSTQQQVVVRENLDVNAGASLSAGSAGAPSHLLRVYGNILNNGDINLRPSPGVVVNSELFGAMVIAGANVPLFNDLTFKTGSSALTEVELNIDGSVTIESGAAWSDGALEHHVAGNWSVMGNGQFNATGTIVFDGMINTVNDNPSGVLVAFHNLVFQGGGVGSLQENMMVSGRLHITNSTIVQTALTLTSLGDFIVDGGSNYMQTGASTIFAGTQAQSIELNGTASFNSVAFSNGGTNAKDVVGNMSVAGTMTLSQGATLSGNGILTVTNGVRIDGTCNLSGTLVMKGGNLTTGNTSNQIVLGTARLLIDGNVSLAYTAPATALILMMANDLVVQGGYIVLNQNTQVTGNATSMLKADAGRLIYVRGSNNFPVGFGTIDLAPTSLVVYDLAADQTVRGGITYGNLSLGGGGRKTVDGSIDINGNLALNSGVILDLQTHSHTLAGDIGNSGNSSIDGGSAVFTLDANDLAQSIAASGTGFYRFLDLNIVQNGASASRNKTFAYGCRLEIMRDFNISNGSGTPPIMLNVLFNNNELGGTPRHWNLGANCQLQTTHPDFFSAFSSRFGGDKTLDINSSVYYSLNGAQTIADGIVYGNITFSGGAKTARGPLDINGSISQSAGTPTFYDAGFTHTIAGDWLLAAGAYYNQASATGTIVFDGIDQTVNGANFNHLVIANSGTIVVTSVTLNVFGNLTIQGGSTLDFDAKNLNIGGHFTVNGSGVFKQTTGVTTYNGPELQTITANNLSSFGGFAINKPNGVGLQTVRALTDMTISGNVSVTTDAGVLDISNQQVTVGGSFYLYPNAVETGSVLIASGSTLVFNGVDAQDIRNRNANPMTLGHLYFSGAGTKQLYYDGFGSPIVNVNGNWTISGSTVDGSNSEIYVTGNWDNSGTFQHGRTVYFVGGDQSISSSTFRHFVSSGTGTKTLLGNITVNGNVTLAAATLDANNQTITLNGNWDNSDADAIFVPGTGSVVFGGANQDVFTGTTSGPQTGKQFYNFVVNATSWVALQGDLDVTNDLTVSTGSFISRTFDIWLAGNLNVTGTFNHSNANSVLTLNGNGGTKTFNPNGATFHGVVVNAPNTKYNVESDFGIQSVNMELLVGEINLNGHKLTVNNNSRQININGGTLVVNEKAEVAMVSNTQVINLISGSLKVTGSANYPAYLTGTNNTFALNQTGGTLHASHYLMHNARVIISGGAIDVADNLHHGTFSGTVTTGAYLTLNGLDFADFSVESMIFNTGAANNIVRTSGSGTITIEDASGPRAGQAFEIDNGVPGTLIEWTFPAGVFWDNDSGDNDWHNAINWSGNTLPTENDIVYLNHNYVTSDYVVNISSADVHMSRVMMDAQGGNVIELKLGTGRSLTMTEHIAIGVNTTLTQTDGTSIVYVGKNWTNLGTHNHGSSSVVFNGTGGESSIYSNGVGVGKSFYRLIIDAPTAIYNLGGPTNVQSDFSILQGQLSAFAAANVLTVGGNWLIDADAGGLFDPSTSTVTFNGADQSITNGTFYNFTTAGTGVKTINSNIKALFHFIIGAGTTVHAGQYNILVSRNWINNGGTLVQSGMGNVIFDGTAGQQVDAGTSSTAFHNMEFSNLGNKTFMRDASTTGSVVVNTGSGIVNLVTWQLTGVGSDNKLTNRATIQLQGADNFPIGFEEIDLTANNTINYLSDINQMVYPTTYGHIRLGRLTNGGTPVKTALGDFDVLGNIVFGDATTTLDMATNDASINLTGNITVPVGSTINWGTGDNATLTHIGSDWSISSNLNGFNHLVLAGTGNKFTQGNLHITGDVVVKSGVYLRMYTSAGVDQFRTMTSDGTGDFIAEAGARVLNSRPATDGPAIPEGFRSYQLDVASLYYMVGPAGVHQTIYTDKGIEYGILYFRYAKNVTSDGIADLVVRGDFEGEASTYFDGGRNMVFTGSNIFLTGYTPSSVGITLTLDRNGNQFIRDNVDNQLVMPTLIVTGSGIKTIGDTNDTGTITGDMNIHTGTTATTARNINFNGTQWQNDGVYTQTAGTLLFNSASDVTIKAGAANVANYFSSLSFDGASVKTFVTDGADINGAFTILSGLVDLGALTHKIYGSITNTVGGTLVSNHADLILDGAGQNINTPPFEVNNITMTGSGIKRMYSNWTVNGNLHIGNGVTLNTQDVSSVSHDLLVRGHWINEGIFTANSSTVTFSGALSPINITSGGSNFYNVNFAPSSVLYKLQSPSSRILRAMNIGASAELTLNGKTLILGSNIASGKVFTVDGTLRVDARGMLKVDNRSSQSQINVSGALYLVGTDGTNIATLTRENAAGLETQVNILSGATFGARYYLIEYLQDAGMNLLSGSTLDALNNLSDGAFQGMRNVANSRYLNLESNYSGGVISNIAFNYSGSPVVGTHYNVWRQSASTPIVFDVVGGSLGNYKFERDEESIASASTGQIQWPAITQTNWTGAMNTNWHEAGNWDNGVPTATLDAVIPDRSNDPIVSDADALCKSLSITNGTLVMDNGMRLTVAGDVEVGTGTNTGILTVNNPSTVIEVGGSWTRGTNSIFLAGGSTVAFNSSNGVATITPRTSKFHHVVFDNNATIFTLVGSPLYFDGNVTIQNGTVTPFAANYVYEMKGDFTNVNGTFSASAVTGGRVELNGASNQNVDGLSFNHLTVAGSGVKHFGKDIAIAGNTVVSSTMSANAGSVIDFNGNMTISAGGTFADGGGTHTFAGSTWTGDGTYNGTGTILFDGAAAQTINSGTFHNLTVNGTAGIFSINNNITVNHDMTIRNGINYADLKIYTVTNPNGDGTFTLEDGEALYVRGANNFPKGFGAYAMGATSITNYDATMDQMVDGISYGHLTLDKAFTKTLDGNTEVKGNLTFNTAMLDVTASNYSLAVGGAWNNNSTGHFICHEGLVTFNGASNDQNINVGASNTNWFYNLTVDKGSGIVSANNNSANNFVIQRNLLVNGGLFSANGRTITVGGDLVASLTGRFSNNTGTYYLNQSSGVANIGTNGSSLLNMTIHGGAIYTVLDELRLIGDFRLETGEFNGNGKEVVLGDNSADVAIIAGTYRIGAGGVLMLGDGTSLTVAQTGRLEVVGSSSGLATVTRNNTGRYNFTVEGTIAAKYYLFEYMSSAGVYLTSTSAIDNANNFSEGTFRYGANNGPLLRVENTQSFVAPNYIANVIFPINSGVNAYNIAKTTATSGTLEFYNATGIFSGEDFDNDPSNLINWTGPVKLTWNGSVSSNWNNANNWTANHGPAMVPTGAEDVVIATAVNQPILTIAGQRTKNLTINNGASILIQSPLDGGDTDLSVNGDITINGKLSLMSADDRITVSGNWTRNVSGTTVLQGLVTFDGMGGARVINNNNSDFYGLTIAGSSLYQLGSPMTVRQNLTIQGGASMDVSVSNHTLTVHGGWINYGSFNARTGKVILQGNQPSNLLYGGLSSFYDLDVNAPARAYSLISALNIKRSLFLINGTIHANGQTIHMGDGVGTDDLTINGTLSLDGGSVLNMSNGSRVNVNSGGRLSLVGQSASNRAVVTSLSSGRYAFNINAGGNIAARFYQISYTNAVGLNIVSGANIDDVNNLSDGHFTNGFPSTGTYITLLAEEGSEVIVNNLIFDAGARYNVSRTSGTTVYFFIDAGGDLSGYEFERDNEAPDATSGLIRWSLLKLYTWLGFTNDWNSASNWYNGVMPHGMANVTIPHGMPHDPQVFAGQTFEANDIKVEAGASLTLNPGARMTVNGNISNHGSLSLVNSVAQPVSLLTHGVVNNPISYSWDYPTGQYVAIGHSVDGNLFDNYGPSASIYKLVKNGWVSVPSSVGFNTVPLMGYYIAFRSDPGTITHYGMLRQGVYTFPMGTTWEMIGNPYSSYLDVKSSDFNISDHYNSVYVGRMGLGAVTFATYNIGTDVSANGGSRYIAPGQAFYIRSFHQGVPVSIGPGARAHGDGGALKSIKRTDDVLRLELISSNITDESVLVFRDVGSDNFSVYYDSEKRFTTGAKEVSLYTKKDGRGIIINALPDEDIENRVIPLYMNIGAESAGLVTLRTTNVVSFMDEVDVCLTDLNTRVEINLRESHSYEFMTEPVVGQNRFELSFKKKESTNPDIPTDIEDAEVLPFKMNVFMSEGRAVVKIDDDDFAGNVAIGVYSVQGSLQSSLISDDARTEVELVNSTHVVLVRVTYSGVTQSFKLVRMVE